MKKFIFTVAAAVSMIACGNNAQETATTQAQENAPAVETLASQNVAYVQVEAVLAECDLMKTEGAKLQAKTEKAQKGWAQRERNLQTEAQTLQEKYQKGLITTRDFQEKGQSIERRAANLQNTVQKEGKVLEEENFVFTNRVQDLLQRAVQDINADKKYKMIVNASALIDADSTLNITPIVLAKVNELYAADKSSKSDK